MRLVIVGVVAALALVGAVLAWQSSGGGSDRHSKAIRPPTTQGNHSHAPTHPHGVSGVVWPTYGFNTARTHAAPATTLHPPFRRVWTMHSDWNIIEFPPVIAYDHLYLSSLHGLVTSVETATGKISWRRPLSGCIAASPTVSRGVVYVVTMAPPPCTANSHGFLVALDARTGRVVWRFRTGPIESSPLLVQGLLYFGSWDGKVYAVDARTGRLKWKFRTEGRVKAGPAWSNGVLYIGSYDGRLYALDAASGALRWSAVGGAFYATPAVAGGRVYVGSTNGVVYAFDADTGRLVWSFRTGSFVYCPVAVWHGTAYVGSYDHHFYALDARTGRLRWSFDAGHPISGAPTVLGGIVYFSTCGSCSIYEENPHARKSYGLNAQSGKVSWRFGDGEYSPVVADARRVYLTGFQTLYGLVPRA